MKKITTSIQKKKIFLMILKKNYFNIFKMKIIIKISISIKILIISIIILIYFLTVQSPNSLIATKAIWTFI